HSPQPREPGRDPRRFYVGPDAVGKAPPPPASAVPAASPAPPAPVIPPAPAPKPPSLPRPKRGGARWRPRRPKWRWIALVSVLVPVVVAAAGLIYVDVKFRQLHRVPVRGALDSGGTGTNILLVGSDTRANADPNDPNAGAILGDATERAPSGQRSDTIMVLRITGDGAKMLSIPRDLIVSIADTGTRERINAAYNTDLGGGPVRLIETVQQNLGIPINRYMEVDFVTFARLVDAVGGVTIDFPYPAYDTNTGLDVQQAGAVKLDGDQALAYVRSRHYTEIREDGKPHEDPTADLGRVQRQQAFLRAVMGKVAGSRNPIALLRAGGEIASGLRVDDKLGLWDAINLAWHLRGVHPESVPLPVAVNADKASLHLKQPDADGVLAQFR